MEIDYYVFSSLYIYTVFFGGEGGFWSEYYYCVCIFLGEGGERIFGRREVKNKKELTLEAPLEHVVLHGITRAPDAHADTVLDVGERVVVDVGVHGLHEGHAGVLHVVNVVVCRVG